MPTLVVARTQFTVICVFRLSHLTSKIRQLLGSSLIMCWSSSNNPACTARATFRVDKSRGKGKGKGTLSLSTSWQHVAGIEVWLYSFLTMAPVGGDEPHAPVVSSPPTKNPNTHRKGGCVAASAAPARIRIPNRPAHSLILAHTTATHGKRDDVNRFRKREKTRFYSLTPALMVEDVRCAHGFHSDTGMQLIFCQISCPIWPSFSLATADHYPWCVLISWSTWSSIWNIYIMSKVPEDFVNAEFVWHKLFALDWSFPLWYEYSVWLFFQCHVNYMVWHKECSV